MCGLTPPGFGWAAFLDDPRLLLAQDPPVARDRLGAAAAAALPVHRNTLLHRIGRIEKLTGLSLKDQRDRTLVLLAVTWEGIAADVPPAPAGAVG